jgi:hypothetical protein
VTDTKQQENMHEFMYEAVNALPNFVGQTLFNKIPKVLKCENESDRLQLGLGFKPFSSDNCKKWIQRNGNKEKWKDVGFSFKDKNGISYVFVFGVDYIYFTQQTNPIDFSEENRVKLNSGRDFKMNNLLKPSGLKEFLHKLEYQNLP